MSVFSDPADYFLNESQRPDMEARISLARKVNAVLQCGYYTQHHVYMRFAALRRRKHFPGRSAPITSMRREEDEDADTRADGAISHPVSVVAKLDVLLEEEPSPTPEVAAIWADILAEGVVPEDILTYALLRQVKRHMDSQNVGDEDRAFTQLSSSASSTSPLSSRTTSPPGDAPARQMAWPIPRAGPGPSQGAKQLQRRETRPRKQIKQPHLVSPPLSSSPSSPRQVGTSSDQEGRGESPEEPESSPNSPSSTAVLSFPVEAQKLAAQIRHALSAPVRPNPYPKTFLDLCALLRGSGCATTL